MANRADVYVKNNLKSCIIVSLGMQKKAFKRNSIGIGNRVKFPIYGPEVELVIDAPGVYDIRECPFKIRSDVDLIITYKRSSSKWIFKIIPNDLPRDVPVSVSITIGEDEPKPLVPDPDFLIPEDSYYEENFE